MVIKAKLRDILRGGPLICQTSKGFLLICIVLDRALNEAKVCNNKMVDLYVHLVHTFDLLA